MKITVITLFPDIIATLSKESIIGKAQKEKKVTLEIINLRDFGHGKRATVDDRPFGGGAGMVLMAGPVVEAIRQVTSNKKQETKQKIILTSPRGQVYRQKTVQEYSKLDHLILICGHYEGIDERVRDYIDEEVSLGDFVMTGGEIAGAAIIDSVVRLLPGVINETSPSEESFFEVDLKTLSIAVGEDSLIDSLKEKKVEKIMLLEYPQYTRPEEFEGQPVPSVLLSGNHQEIANWRLKQAWEVTKKRRPDLIKIDMIK